jgi:DNA (cytosine-5)-methyltransferase 1
VCGNQIGISGERSGLFYKVIDLLKGKSPKNRPKWLLFENVKNLISINCGADFTEVLYQISEVGYDCEWQVINSKLYVPQNRERVFIIGHLRAGTERTRQVFPIGRTNNETTTDLIEKVGGMQGNRIYCSKGIGTCLISQGGGLGAVTGLYCTGSDNEMCFIDLCMGNPQITNIARCIKARYNVGLSNRTAENSGVLTGGSVRKLTPKECFRLQGFSDAMFERAAAVTSDNQLYKQAGNSVTVPVVREIGERLMKAYGGVL